MKPVFQISLISRVVNSNIFKGTNNTTIGCIFPGKCRC